MSSKNWQVEPGGSLRGDLRVPGDKSISHRAIMLGAIAKGETRVDGFLDGEDCLATLEVFRKMGVKIEKLGPRSLQIQGVGVNGLKAPTSELYLGNSGTSMRLLTGLLSGQKFSSVLAGDDSLTVRPMERVTKPLKKMGACLETETNGTAPIRISPSAGLESVDYRMPMASAQVKSCLLLAGLYADGTTCVIEPAPTRDHTERMLRGFGYSVETNGPRISLEGGGELLATDVDVPADISSAAFFLVGASIAPDSDLTLRHTGINPTRTGIINILRLMGANIECLNERVIGGEPVADLRVRSAVLNGIEIPLDQVPLGIDEFPAIFIAAACAEGQTVLRGAAELRVKESDRIAVMAEGLEILGIEVEVTDDGMVIQGGLGFNGGRVNSYGDHRIAMSFAMAALRASAQIQIQDCANVDTSFPGFKALAQSAGLGLI